MADKHQTTTEPSADYFGQYVFSLPELERLKFEGSVVENLKRLSREYHETANKLSSQYRDFLEGQGYPVFEVYETNDRQSIEADFGAPGLGIPFATQIFDFDRAARYVQVSNNEGALFTHSDKALDIVNSLENDGYLIFRDLDNDIKRSQIHFANGGVTRCFADTIDGILDDHAEMQPKLSQFDMQQSGAIILPVPTYGLFHYQLEEATEAHDVQIITVHRNDDGSVNERSLQHTLDSCYDQNIRVLAYYDCNPNNPSGYIRDEEKTRQDAAILMKANKRECARHEKTLGKMLDETDRKNAKGNDLFSVYGHLTDDSSRGSLMILDDMAYEGLELDDNKKPFSFGQVSDEVADRTVVLKSMSKIGMPGLRTGLMIGPDSLIRNMASQQLMREFTANNFGVDMLWARFGANSPFKDHFKQHKINLKRSLLRKSREFEALFLGLDNVPDMSDFAKRSLVEKYSKAVNIDEQEALERLQKGLPNFHLMPRPDAGFFRRVSFDSLVGKSIALKFQKDDMPAFFNIHSSNDQYWAMKAFKIDQIPSVSQGLSNASFTTRISIAMPNKDDQFLLYDRLREMHDYFFGSKPEVQMDFFRQNPLISSHC